MFTLSKKISIYVPSIDKDGNEVNQDIRNRILDHVGMEMTSTNGGATVMESTGWWKHDDGSMIKERVTQVMSYTNDPDEALQKALEIAEYIKTEMNQEGVSIETDKLMIV